MLLSEQIARARVSDRLKQAERRARRRQVLATARTRAERTGGPSGLRRHRAGEALTLRA